jgi:putative tryptophan/tyrosine transport system substrate-binding protein
LHCTCLLLTQTGHSPLQSNKLTRYDSVEARGAVMRRRDFISGVLGSAAVWPFAALAQQQPGRVRLIGALTGVGDDAESKVRYAAFRQELQRLGWIDGQNVRIEVRFGEGNAARIHKQAAELVALSPDVILTTGGLAAELMLQATRTIPIVFALLPDPVGSGLVASLAEPGGNATGFSQFEYSLSAKWPELLKEIAPNLKRVAVIWDPKTTAGIGQFAVIQSVAPAIGIDVRPISVHGDIESVIAKFARVPNGGLVVTASAPSATATRLELITTLAARHKLPVIAPFKFFVISGGLMSYGPDFVEQYRRAAGYIDRILKGEKPADLPVQAPNKYELVINLKTAKELGLTVPPTLLARADEVVE